MWLLDFVHKLVASQSWWGQTPWRLHPAPAEPFFPDASVFKGTLLRRTQVQLTLERYGCELPTSPHSWVFSTVNTTVLHVPRLVESEDAEELGTWEADDKLNTDFQLHGGSVPPHPSAFESATVIDLDPRYWDVAAREGRSHPNPRVPFLCFTDKNTETQGGCQPAKGHGLLNSAQPPHLISIYPNNQETSITYMKLFKENRNGRWAKKKKNWRPEKFI